MMKVSVSGYYTWRRKPEVKTDTEKNEREAVRKCFYEHRKRYGTRRIAEELREQGIRIGRWKVRRLMREQGLKAINPKRFRPQTTDSKHNKLASPNLLQDKANEPQSWGEVIVGDITYIRLSGGRFCYLAIWQDKLTRRIVGWELSTEMTADLVIRALQKGLRQGLIKAGAIIHSDRGSQYVSNAFRELLKRCSLRQSMSGRGNCYDNAQAESFFSRFKTELIEDGIFADWETARSEVFSYIEFYYNRKRRHSGIGYKTPIKKEEKLRQEEKRRTRDTKVSATI